MRLYLIFILSLTFLFFTFRADAQKMLVVKKKGSVKTFYYKPGDKIIVSAYEENYRYSGRILGITITELYVGEDSTIAIPIQKINCVYKGRHLFREAQVKLPVAGLIYLALSGFNSLINNEQPIYRNTDLLVTGGLIAAGMLVSPLKYRKFDMNKKWQLMVLDFSFEDMD